MAKIYEQAYIANPAGGTYRPVYSWILDGVSHRRNSELSGWTWIRGCGGRGCYTTTDQELVADTANRIGVDVVSNGTHEVLGVPVLLCDPTK